MEDPVVNREPAVENTPNIDFNSIREAMLKAAQKAQGTHCPLCERYLKVYKRPLNRPMTLVLFLIAKYFKNNKTEEWLHVENYISALGLPPSLRGDFHKLRWWGLITKKEGISADGNPNLGLYKITKEGSLFIEGKIKVRSHAIMWGGPGGRRRLSFTENEVSVVDTLGHKFSYNEIMTSGVEDLVLTITKYCRKQEEKKRKAGGLASSDAASGDER